MKFYLINTLSSFIHNDFVSEFHDVMFHGMCERNGKRYPHDPKVWASDNEIEPLSIVRSGIRMPPVTRPSTHLVVTKDIARLLPATRCIVPVQVDFLKLIDIDFKEGDFSWYQIPRPSPVSFLWNASDNPQLHFGIEDHFEMVTLRLSDVRNQYDDISLTEISVDSSDGEAIRIGISKSIIRDYPMLWLPERSIMTSQDVFDVLEPSLDERYFEVREYDV